MAARMKAFPTVGKTLQIGVNGAKFCPAMASPCAVIDG